jgi:single-strand DNA-binding protein
LIGHVGSDPELKYTQGGMAICTLSLATTSVRKDKDGNQQEQTQWHRVKLFGKLGEIAGEYVKKGRQIYILGSIRYDKFTGQDGQERYFTDIIAEEMQLLGSGDRAEPAARSGNDRAAGRVDRGAPQGNGSSNGSHGARGGGPVRPAPSTGPTGAHDEFPDDVPFVVGQGPW